MRTRNTRPIEDRYLVKHIPTGLYYNYNRHLKRGGLSANGWEYAENEIPILPEFVLFHLGAFTSRVWSIYNVYKKSTNLSDWLSYKEKYNDTETSKRYREEVSQINAFFDVIKKLKLVFSDGECLSNAKYVYIQTTPSDWEIIKYPESIPEPKEVAKSKEVDIKQGKPKNLNIPSVSFNLNRLGAYFSKLMPRKETDTYCKKYK